MSELAQLRAQIAATAALLRDLRDAARRLAMRSYRMTHDQRNVERRRARQREQKRRARAAARLERGAGR